MLLFDKPMILDGVPGVTCYPDSDRADLHHLLASQPRIRVDDVTGLPQLLGPGTHADVLVAGVLRVADAEVMARPRRNGDGVSWSVALRLPAALAAEVARAEARGQEIRLLPRDVRP